MENLLTAAQANTLSHDNSTELATTAIVQKIEERAIAGELQLITKDFGFGQLPPHAEEEDYSSDIQGTLAELRDLGYEAEVITRDLVEGVTETHLLVTW